MELVANQKIVRFIIYLVVLCLPLYLMRFKILGVPFNAPELMIYIGFLLWTISFLKNKKYSFLKIRSSFYLPILLILAGATVSSIFSLETKISAGIWKGWFIAPIIFFFVFTDVMREKKYINNSIFSLAISGIFVSIISLIYWVANILTYDGRLRAFYLSPNYLAMYLSPILLLSMGLAFDFKNKYLKTTVMLGCSLMMLIIFLTYSYGAWLGLFASFLIVFLMLAKKRRKSRKFLFVLILIPIIFFLFQFSSPKFESLVNFEDNSLSSRFAIWRSAATIIKDNPIIGIGPGLFQKYYLDYQPRFKEYQEWAVPQPHNLFLAFWLQTGLAGIIGFVWILIVFFYFSIKKTPKEDLYKIFFVAAMLSIITHGLVDTTYWKSDLAVVFWFIIALSYTRYYLCCSQK